MQIELNDGERGIARGAVEFAQQALPESFQQEGVDTVTALQAEGTQDLTPVQANIILKAINNPGFVLSRMLAGGGSIAEEDGVNAHAAYGKVIEVIFARAEELDHDYAAVVREVSPQEVLETMDVAESADGLREAHDEAGHQHATA